MSHIDDDCMDLTHDVIYEGDESLEEDYVRDTCVTRFFGCAGSAIVNRFGPRKLVAGCAILAIAAVADIPVLSKQAASYPSTPETPSELRVTGFEKAVHGDDDFRLQCGQTEDGPSLIIPSSRIRGNQNIHADVRARVARDQSCRIVPGR